MDPAEVEVRVNRIVNAALAVHKALGPGLLESAYESCLAYELRRMGSSVQVQVPIPISYRDVVVEMAYRLDMLVDDVVIVELKALPKLLPIHEAQMLSYLRLRRLRIGLLINFHELRLKHGIRRMVNGY
jgi:GxxExxY protein